MGLTDIAAVVATFALLDSVRCESAASATGLSELAAAHGSVLGSFGRGT